MAVHSEVCGKEKHIYSHIEKDYHAVASELIVQANWQQI